MIIESSLGADIDVRHYGARPEMDPLTEQDALQEAQLLDVRVDALRSTVGLSFELRMALVVKSMSIGSDLAGRQLRQHALVHHLRARAVLTRQSSGGDAEQMKQEMLSHRFAELAPVRFQFLVASEHFLGCEVLDDGLSYFFLGLRIDVMLDLREQTVLTVTEAFDGTIALRAPLACLCVAASLGPAQDVKRTVRTRHTLEQSLDSHATALRKVLPMLEGPQRLTIMRACHGRYV